MKCLPVVALAKSGVKSLWVRAMFEADGISAEFGPLTPRDFCHFIASTTGRRLWLLSSGK